MSTDHNFWIERRAEADSNRGSSAYRPNAFTARPNQLTLKRIFGSPFLTPQLRFGDCTWEGLGHDNTLSTIQSHSVIQARSFLPPSMSQPLGSRITLHRAAVTLTHCVDYSEHVYRRTGQKRYCHFTSGLKFASDINLTRGSSPAVGVGPFVLTGRRLPHTDHSVVSMIWPTRLTRPGVGRGLLPTGQLV